MPASFIFFAALQHCLRTAATVLLDLAQFALLAAHSRSTLAAENVFLRKQLALFQKRKVKPRQAADTTRWIMVTLSHLLPWRGALVNVKPNTFIGWHRKGFRLFWRWKSARARRDGRRRGRRGIAPMLNARSGPAAASTWIT